MARARNLGRGQTQKISNTPTDYKVFFTTERDDGLLVAQESRPVGFGQSAEEWNLEMRA
jgi:hypothetical protein